MYCFVGWITRGIVPRLKAVVSFFKQNSIIPVPIRSCAIDNCVNQVFQLRLQWIPNIDNNYDSILWTFIESALVEPFFTFCYHSRRQLSCSPDRNRLRSSCLVYLTCTHMDGGTLLWWLYLTATYRPEDQQPRFVWKGKNAGSKHNRRERMKSRVAKWCQSVKFTISIRLWGL